MPFLPIPRRQIVLNLGTQASSELFRRIDDPDPDPTFPLRMWLCADCGLAQLPDDTPVSGEPVGEWPAAVIAQRRDAVAHLVAGLQVSVRDTSRRLHEMLEEQQERGSRVYGYRAAARAVSLLRLAEVDASLLCGVADASPVKQGRRMPGTDIPVISPDQLVAESPDIVVVFVDEMVEEVRRALPQIEAAGGRWLSAGSGR